jgi:GST-like protein
VERPFLRPPNAIHLNTSRKEANMANDLTYTPPKVWTWEAESGGKFASINRPVAGPTHDKELQIGKHPLQLYSLATPNGVKVTILLEELLAAGHIGAEYDAWLVNIGEGVQFGSGFVDVNPNSKIPALMDHSVTPPQRVFESGAILLYLAEKFGTFIPQDPAQRTEMMSWLFWQMGSAPYLGGGFGHFYAYAPEKYEYPINRFSMETKRQLDVMDRHLAQNEWLSRSGPGTASWCWAVFIPLPSFWMWRHTKASCGGRKLLMHGPRSPVAAW